MERNAPWLTNTHGPTIFCIEGANYAFEILEVHIAYLLLLEYNNINKLSIFYIGLSFWVEFDGACKSES
jgi:hypothetical protein